MKENKNKKGIKIVLIIFSLVICFTGGFFTHYLMQPASVRKLSDILSLMNMVAKDPYGNDLDFDADTVAKQFVNAILKNDDYATYFTDQEYKEKNTEGRGQYSGIGISFYADAPIIYSVYGNSPAENAGIKKGDSVLRAKLTSEETYHSFSTTDDVINFFSQIEEGERVELVVKREGELKEKSFNLTKRKYVCSYVYYYDSETSLRFVSEGEGSPQKTFFKEEKIESLPLDTALIVFRAFEGDCVKQLEEAFSYFYSSGKSKLIFDLRGNGGGYLDILRDVASYFITNGGKNKNLVTEVEERKGFESYYTKSNNFDDRLKNVVVLANEGTASASECLIGAMLCYGDANFSYDNLLISYNNQRGDYSTYGKGIMQTTYPLLSGGALKLTTARIYWPDGETCIHGKGIVQNNPLNQVSDDNVLSRAIEILSN